MLLSSPKLMRVRSITGATYFLRSGAKLTGQVHERFMLIDGNRVATGSYRYRVGCHQSSSDDQHVRGPALVQQHPLMAGWNGAQVIYWLAPVTS